MAPPAGSGVVEQYDPFAPDGLNFKLWVNGVLVAARSQFSVRWLF